MFYAGLAAGGYKLLKGGTRALGINIWPKESSLDSIDPLERADAARLAAKIKAAKGPDTRTELVKGARGAFEVFKDGALVFSKLATGQFPDSEEAVVKLL